MECGNTGLGLTFRPSSIPGSSVLVYLSANLTLYFSFFPRSEFRRFSCALKFETSLQRRLILYLYRDGSLSSSTDSVAEKRARAGRCSEHAPAAGGGDLEHVDDDLAP